MTGGMFALMRRSVGGRRVVVARIDSSWEGPRNRGLEIQGTDGAAPSRRYLGQSSCDGLRQDTLLGEFGLETHKSAQRGGNLTLIDLFIHHLPARHAGAEQQRKDFMRRFRIEMMLAWHVRERIAVAAAIRHDTEDGVFAIFGVGFNRLD